MRRWPPRWRTGPPGGAGWRCSPGGGGNGPALPRGCGGACRVDPRHLSLSRPCRADAAEHVGKRGPARLGAGRSVAGPLPRPCRLRGPLGHARRLYDAGFGRLPARVAPGMPGALNQESVEPRRLPARVGHRRLSSGVCRRGPAAGRPLPGRGRRCAPALRGCWVSRPGMGATLAPVPPCARAACWRPGRWPFMRPLRAGDPVRLFLAAPLPARMARTPGAAAPRGPGARLGNLSRLPAAPSCRPARQGCTRRNRGPVRAGKATRNP